MNGAARCLSGPLWDPIIPARGHPEGPLSGPGPERRAESGAVGRARASGGDRRPTGAARSGEPAERVRSRTSQDTGVPNVYYYYIQTNADLVGIIANLRRCLVKCVRSARSFSLAFIPGVARRRDFVGDLCRRLGPSGGAGPGPGVGSGVGWCTSSAPLRCPGVRPRGCGFG